MFIVNEEDVGLRTTVKSLEHGQLPYATSSLNLRKPLDGARAAKVAREGIIDETPNKNRDQRGRW